MQIRDLFVADVTRDIPPVVYFHEQSPPKLQAEVSEYIVTGGYPEGDPRAQRVKSGIHEQFVQSAQPASCTSSRRRAAPSCPPRGSRASTARASRASPSSSGSRSTASCSPTGRRSPTALLNRDDSPRRQELVDAWNTLAKRVNPIAVVFDIGAVARDNEHIHAAVLRQVQARLGYCRRSNLVADYELRLERDGEWDAVPRRRDKDARQGWDESPRTRSRPRTTSPTSCTSWTRSATREPMTLDR